mgnify:CR=1 FL=1
MTKKEKKLLFIGFLYATDPTRGRTTGAEGSEHAKIAWHIFVDPTPTKEASPEIKRKMINTIESFNKAFPNIIKNKDDKKMLINLGKKWKPSANEYTQRIQRTDGTTTRERITVYQWMSR